MSHSSKIFDSAPIKVQNRNGFDLSHLNCGSSKCGQLVPVLTKLLPPNTDFTLGCNMEVNLPPLATTFYGRIDAIVEGFVVPCSILYGGWKQFISNNPVTGLSNLQKVYGVNSFLLPYLDIDDSYTMTNFKTSIALNNCLFDYFGFQLNDLDATDVNTQVSLLPFLAYHLIWNTFYRNKNITTTCFEINPNGADVNGLNEKAVSLIWHSYYWDDEDDMQTPKFMLDDTNDAIKLADGIPIYSTRQRNYARDYFTSATTSPQQGNSSSLKFSVVGTADDDGGVSGDGSFTIGALRAANSLQKFLETNNLSQDYADMMRNRWGTRPIDADFDEPYYLGRVIVPVYQKGIYQQDSSAKAGAVNPFAAAGAIGAKGAAAGFNGSGKIGNYHNTTWSFVMCLFSLVPHALYGQGRNRELDMLNIGDFPAPEFQSIGYEEISAREVYNSVDTYYDDLTFGYIPRYSRFKYMDDTVHGELREGRSLENFVLQRVFEEPIQMTTDFLTIGQSDLDGIFAVSTGDMNLSCWYEIFFEFKVVMPLADFCIPTLGDIQDTHTIKTSIAGSKL